MKDISKIKEIAIKLDFEIGKHVSQEIGVRERVKESVFREKVILRIDLFFRVKYIIGNIYTMTIIYIENYMLFFKYIIYALFNN